MTLRDKFIKGLELNGYVKVKDTGKYLVYGKGAHNVKYYIGKRGSLRWGRTVTESVPASDQLKNKLITRAEKETQK